MRSVVRSLEKVLGLTGHSERPRRVVSWSQDFAELWRLDEAFLAEFATTPLDLIVVWDRLPCGPSTPVAFAHYLSPLDWAVALELSLKKTGDGRGGAASPTSGRVVILTFGRDTTGIPAGLLARLQGSQNPVLPWLRILDCTQSRKLANVLQAVSSMQPVPCPSPIDVMAGLRDLWLAHITRSGDPADLHAIANLIGPRLLLGRLGTTADDCRVAALERLLRVLDVLPDVGTGDAPDFPWIPRKEWEPHELKFVLVDDLHAEGWSEFLIKALDARGDLIAIASPNKAPLSLLDLLSDNESLLRWKGLEGHEWDRRVLLLDLRLFSRQPVADEMNFFTRLLELAREKTGFDDKDLVAVERCIASRQRETPDYLVALTLLPRLLAMADPLLPIIIFSSTGQRAIVDRLRRHDNILTDFDKPRLHGQKWDQVVTDAHGRLSRVVSRACAMTEARALCRRLLRSKPVPDTVGTGWKLCEIFLDESGNSASRFIVGGIAILHSSSDGPKLVDQALKKEKLAWGLAEGWAPARAEDKLPPAIAKYRPPNEDLADLKRLQQVVENEAGGRILAFALSTAGEREQSIDGVYRSMVREVLEALQFIVLPEIGCGGVQLAIDVATRVTGSLPRLQGGGIMEREDAVRAFGIRPVGDKYHSLDQDHVLGLVLDVMALRDRNLPDGGLARARGVTLCACDDLHDMQRAWRKKQEGREPTKKDKDLESRYVEIFKEKNVGRRPSQVHYAADMVVRAVCRNQIGDPLLRWFENGFLDDRKMAHKRLAASRLAESNAIAEALATLWELDHANPSPSSSLRMWVELEAEQWSRDFLTNPRGIRELVDRIEILLRMRKC